MNRIWRMVIVLGLLLPGPELFSGNRNAGEHAEGFAAKTNLALFDQGSDIHPYQYFVKLAPDVSQEAIDAMLEELNSVEIWKNDRIGLRLWAVRYFPYACSAGPVTDIKGHVVRSKSKSDIDDVDNDMIYQIDPNVFSGLNLRFDQLPLRAAAGSAPVKISILDTGVSDLSDNTHEKYNFGLSNYTGYDYVNNDPDPDDENGHGTHVAGLIYHIVNQAEPAANITFDIRKTHDRDGFGQISDLIIATLDAVDAGANVINMSYSYMDFPGVDKFRPLELAISYARDNGVLVVTSAGNNGINTDRNDLTPFPASFTEENILTVASNNHLDELSSFSNFGPFSVDVSILGENIPGPDLAKGISYRSGTSHSTAIVTALAAILGSRQEQFDYCAVKCLLINSTRALSAMRCQNLAGGVIDFQRAINAPPASCSSDCGAVVVNQDRDCDPDCPPEAGNLEICAAAGQSIGQTLPFADPENGQVTINTKPVYGPFYGTATINPDGTFTYTSKDGRPDMFVFQTCEEDQLFDVAGRSAEPAVDCCASAGKPVLLRMQYTGDGNDGTRHRQEASKVSCLGDPQNAPLVYIIASEKANGGGKIFFAGTVQLGGVFDILAARAEEARLKAETHLTIKTSANGNVLQMIKFHTSCSQPLSVGDQFGAALVVTVVGESGVCEGSRQYCNDGCTQGVVYVNTTECAPLADCCQETGKAPKLLTFRYTGEGCGASAHRQAADKVSCSGDPQFAPVVYVTAEGDKTYFTGLAVPLHGTFSIDAAALGEPKLRTDTRVYLKDAAGNVLQSIKFHTSCAQPLGVGDQFGSLLLEGFLSEADAVCGTPDLDGRQIYDCCKETGKAPKLLTLRYTGDHCEASNHAQGAGKANCWEYGEPGQIAYITAVSDAKTYVQDRVVSVGETFTIDAAAVGDTRLQSSTWVYIRNERGNILQLIEFSTACTEPLGVGDQFASLVVEGYLSESNLTCGNPQLDNRDIYDCCKETGAAPQLLTFRYIGEGCEASLHSQRPDKVSCSGDPFFATEVYVTVEGGDVYLDNQKVMLGGTFNIDAARVSKSKLAAVVRVHLKDAQGNLLQLIEFSAACTDPLGVGDQFASLLLEGFVAESGLTCGAPETENRREVDECIAAGGKPRALTLRYTGADCHMLDHTQDPRKVISLGDPNFAPFVYVTVLSGDTYFTDLKVPLGETFTIDAAAANRSTLDKSTKVYLRDERGTILQSVQFETSCSQPLVIGDHYGSLSLEGYRSETNVAHGREEQIIGPDGKELPDCGCEGKLAAVGLMYTGGGETTVIAYEDAGHTNYLGAYSNVNSGDVIAFSSFYRDDNVFKELYLSIAGWPGIQIPVFCGADMLGKTYGVFRIVYQADEKGNICSVDYPGCQEIDPNCRLAEEAFAAAVVAAPEQVAPEPVERAALPVLHYATQDARVRSVNVFPNPARDIVFLDLHNFTGEPADVLIYDATARLVRSLHLESTYDGPLSLDVSGLHSGLYTVVIRPYRGEAISKRVVISR